MSEPERKSSDSMEIPRVLVLSSGPARYLQCDYPNVDFKFAEEMNIPTATLFNEFNNNKDYDLTVYMSKDYDFVNRSSLELLVEKALDKDLDYADAFYTDINAMVNGTKGGVLKSYPTAGRKIVNSRAMINIPFVLKRGVRIRFDDRFEIMFLQNGIRRLFDEWLLFNIPQSIFAINNFNQSSDRLREELEFFNE